MNEPLIVLFTALGTNVTGFFGTYYLKWYSAKESSKREIQVKLNEACITLNSHALSLISTCNVLYRTSILRSGLREVLDIALHYRKPLEPMTIQEWLNIDLRPMMKAQCFIEVTGSKELIESSSAVISAGLEVLGKVSGIENNKSDSKKSHLKSLGIYSLRPDPLVETELLEAIRALGRKIREFTKIVRDKNGISDPDAVIKAFPDLFEDSMKVAG